MGIITSSTEKNTPKDGNSSVCNLIDEETVFNE
jgi:hypothetical protein